MIYRFNKHKDEYFVLCRQCVENKQLSLRAKGLHCYLMSLGEGVSPNLSDITGASSDGKSSVQSAIEELKTHGYIRQTVGEKITSIEVFELQQGSESVAKSDSSTINSLCGHYKTTMKSNVTLDKALEDANDNAKAYAIVNTRDIAKNTKSILTNIPNDSENAAVKDENWSRMIFSEWYKAFNSKPLIWEVKLIKPICQEHGTDKVSKVLSYYLNHEEKRFISLRAFSSKFGYWLSKAGLSIKSSLEIKNEETLRYQKPSRQ